MHHAVIKYAKIFILLAMVMMAGCKPRVPKEYIQPRKLENILYDYHVADGMAYAESNYQDLAFRRQAYREAALRKHGVTQAELDSSLVYYYRHTERLHDIYQNLAKRLNNDAVALGATTNELSQFEGMTGRGDTATVWNSAQSVALMPQAPYNCVTFDVKADTAYHEGDKMILAFDCQFIFQEGTRDGVAMLAVTFRNDSTATQVMHLSSDNHYSVQITDNDRVGVKNVRGFIYLAKGNSSPSPSASLRLMCISNMKLMRMHTSEKQQEDEPDARYGPGMGGIQIGDNGPEERPLHPRVDNDNQPGDGQGNPQQAMPPNGNNRPVRQFNDPYIPTPNSVPAPQKH